MDFDEKDKVEEEIGIILNDSDGHPVTIRQVKDSFDATHIITRTLGQGGQGLVCLTKNPEIVVKFALDAKGHLISREKNKVEFERNDREFKSVVFKPFPDRIHLAHPMACLADYSGYVMRLMGDMTSFSDLVPTSEDGIKKMAEDGGHRRRFLLLSKLASLLAKLHANGIVYCDLSPNNVFVTKNQKQKTQNVWLIDADNVFIPGEDVDKLVYTPRYAAPELFEKKPCSQNSDIYSFATLAFETLSAIHPFAGEKATNWNDDDGDDWDASTNGKSDTSPAINPQYSGKYPWVEDIEDDSNHTEAGLPRQNFLTDETFALFNMTFSEQGRESPKSRPGASLWARALAHSNALSVQCPDCKMSFVFDGKQKICPWCDKELPKLLLLKDENERIVFAHELNISYSENEFSLPEHIFLPFDIDSFFLTAMVVRSTNQNSFALEFKLDMNRMDGREFFVSINDKEEKIVNRYILRLKKGEKYSLVCKDSKSGKNRTLKIVLTEVN
ncbi:MAG: protein kinase [Treponema sp.]|nr:protein kinase [Treponema sp.]